MNQIKQIFSEKLHTPVWLAILMSLVLLLRIPSFFEPYSNSIETTYLAVGEGLRRGMMLYKDIYIDSPPFLPMTAAIAGNLFLFKSILTIWHIGTIYVFWKLSQKLFPKNYRLQKLSSVIFALFLTFPLLQGNIVSSESFILGPIMLAFYLLFQNKVQKRYLLISGVLFSIAALFKVTATFEMFTIILFWLITANILKKKELKQVLWSSGWLISGFLIPQLVTFLYYWYKGVLQAYLASVYLQNVGYLFSTLILIVVLGLVLIIWKKRSLSNQFIFLFIWLLLSLYASITSGQISPHNFLHSLAPVSLFFGILFTKNDMEQPLSIIPLALFFFVPFYFNLIQYSSLDYYMNFVNFASGRITNEEYFNFFGENTVHNYKVANYLQNNSTRGDYVFIWSDNASIYAMSKRLPPIRYVSNQHIDNFYLQEQMIKELNKKYPKLIVILRNSTEPHQLKSFLYEHYSLTARIDDTEVWRLLEPDIRSLIAP